MLLFDKSLLQAISLDESVWLEQFFLINITPLFYVETLADLEKEVKSGKTPEQVVGELARKTPVAGTFFNVHHHRLLINDLLGNSVEMAKRPFIRGGKPKITPEGKIVFFFDESPEDKAFKRWSEREFLEIEKDAAKQWRQALSGLTFETMMGIVKNTVPLETHFSNLEDIKLFVDNFTEGNDKALLDLAMLMLDVPAELQLHVIKRWEEKSKPALNKFAPYACYVLKVDMLFYLALNFGFISKDRPSNKIDLSYLYYLPFTMIFVSRDKLHKRLAPLFISKGQLFVWGDDMKAGLKELDDYYSKYQKEIEEVGVMGFAHYPPREVETIIGRLWDIMGTKWRKDAESKPSSRELPQDQELLKKLKDQEENSKPIDGTGLSVDDADSVTFTRRMFIQRGKWRILPKGIENKKQDR